MVLYAVLRVLILRSRFSTPFLGRPLARHSLARKRDSRVGGATSNWNVWLVVASGPARPGVFGVSLVAWGIPQGMPRYTPRYTRQVDL